MCEEREERRTTQRRYISHTFESNLPENGHPDYFADRYESSLDCKGKQICLTS